ncbi:hypothetical protein O181_010842 [Austropuccinia psidii MF-1]|uniref:Uncharacterized protein n=1 Tax=Austropuccinia psidii MF-1 TaxID=1389203 RepID=A0A9Q3BTG4_9BASI|nr:hypothetical protein [Austropuccinia psidii MF-1]
MPVQHSPPINNKRSPKNKAALTPTERDSLQHTPSAHQLGENLDRGPPMKGEAPTKRGGTIIRLGEPTDEEGEESKETEVAAALKGATEASEAPKLNQIFSI